MRLRHVTLTTGHVRDSERSEVSDAALAAVQALLSACLADTTRTQPIPVPGYSLGAQATSRCLSAVVWTNGPPSEPVATIGVATHSRCGAGLWRALHRWGSLPVATDPGRCPAEPWVAAALDAGILRHPEAAHWLGDFERCLGWAWLALVAARHD